MSVPLEILLAVHNGERFLGEALDSLRAQTFDRWRLVAVDDGSEDGTRALLERAAQDDERVRVVRCDRRQGLPVALNRGLAQCSAPLVARADADDVYHPERLARQVAFLEANPRVGVLGTAAKHLDEAGRVVGRTEHPLSNERLRLRLPFQCPLVHPSVVLRRELLERVGGYDDRRWAGQDYDLWARLAPHTRLANLPQRLVGYRVHGDALSAHPRREAARRELDLEVHQRLIEAGLERAVSAAQAEALVQLVCPSRALEAGRVEGGLALLGDWLEAAAGRETPRALAELRRLAARGLVAQAGLLPTDQSPISRHLLARARAMDPRSGLSLRALALSLRLALPAGFVQAWRAA